MTRYFNTEGCCRSDMHYMVSLDTRLKAIRELFVDRGKYCVINRGRQYGKTTTLMALAEYLRETYTVIAMDFQLMSTASFVEERTFVIAFIEYLEDLFSADDELMSTIGTETFQSVTSLKMKERITLDEMFRSLSRTCKAARKPIVLIIDEVDSASNNQVFIDFLAQLRGYYLARDRRPIFQSVLLAGVYDIKNLKMKIRPDDQHQYNSPWNISADFDIDMSFSEDQIGEMLEEYEVDHQTGMDEKLPNQPVYSDHRGIWTEKGVSEAVKVLLRARTTLFDSMIKHVNDHPALKEILHTILFQGEQVVYNQYNPAIELAHMFGYVVKTMAMSGLQTVFLKPACTICFCQRKS